MTDSGFISDYCRHHRGELLAYVSSRLHDVCLAEDIVQDVFLRLLTATQVISPAAIHGLALTMARHLMADHFRRQARHEHFEHFIVYSQPGSGEPESVVSAALLTEQLEHQLARHDDESARIYRLHLYDGMGVGDIARELRLDYKHVEYRLGHVRKDIRTHFSKLAS